MRHVEAVEEIDNNNENINEANIQNVSTHLSIHKLKIYQLLLFITHDAFDIADTSSMQDACHI